MQSLKQLEKDWSQKQLHSIDGEPARSGTLLLRRRKTRFSSLGASSEDIRNDEKGWFDLVLCDQRGVQVLLHNAFVTSSVGSGIDGSKVDEEIFPNVVVFDAEQLSDGTCVNAISFQIEDFGNFFWYNLVEWQSLYKTPKEKKKFIKELRLENKIKTQYGKNLSDYDFNNPSDLYLLHKPSKCIDFKIDDKNYEIFVGYKQKNFASDGISIRKYPVASIRFDEPVVLKQALDSLWSWKRFFVQLAMTQLVPTAISVKGIGANRRTPPASIYLPNVKKPRKERNSWDKAGPGNLPYNSWRERKLLAAVMEAWLRQEKKKSKFRIIVDHVIESRVRRSSMNDVSNLCAAIESVEELSSKNAYRSKDIAALANGAIAAAKSIKLAVQDSRIKGILGMLQATSMPQRIDNLFSVTLSCLSKSGNSEDFVDLQTQHHIKSHILNLRQDASHGSTTFGPSMPVTAPTTQFLLSLCVILDLSSAGVPIRFRDSSLVAANQAAFAAGELSRLHSRT